MVKGLIIPGIWNSAEIKFKRDEVIALLQYLPYLKPKGVEGLDLALELEARLQSCGIHGLMAKAYYAWGDDTDTIAKYFKYSKPTIERWIKRVIQYISGENRKEITFKQFVQQKFDRRYRRKRNNNHS